MSERRRMRPPLFLCSLGLALVLVLYLAAAASAEPILPMDPGDGEVFVTDEGAPVPPNVRPCFIIAGSDYDMGYQYYREYQRIFGSWALTPTVSGMTSGEFTDEQVAALKAYQWILMEEVPWAIDFIKGAAAGASDAGVPMSYATALANFTGVKSYPGTEPEGSQGEDLPPADCSGWAAWGSATKDGRLVCGGNGDHDLADKNRPEFTVMMYPEDGNNVVFSPPTGGVFHPGMSSAGVSYVHHGGNYTGNLWTGEGKNKNTGYGLPRFFAVLHTLRYAQDAIQAKDMMSTLNLTGDRANKGLWVDVKGNAFDIECLDPLAIREPGYMGERDFIYATNNTMHRALEEFQVPSPDMGLYYIRHAGYLGATYYYYDPESITRNLSFWNMAHNYHGQIDLEFGKMFMRFTGPGFDYDTLAEAEDAYFETLGKGWHTPMGCVSNAHIGVMQPDDGDGGLYLVANGGVSRGGYPECPDYNFHPYEKLNSFYQLTLAASPEDAVEASRVQAMRALFDADQELRKLNYRDCGYAALEAIFNEASLAWTNGRWHTLKAEKAAGNEAIALWGKALRAFAECEAKANHVYEGLVPPPNMPEDLGLRKWWGKWGDWATRGPLWDEPTFGGKWKKTDPNWDAAERIL